MSQTRPVTLVSLWLIAFRLRPSKFESRLLRHPAHFVPYCCRLVVLLFPSHLPFNIDTRLFLTKRPPTVGGLGNVLGDTLKGTTGAVGDATKGVGNVAKDTTGGAADTVHSATGSKQDAENPLGLSK